MLRLIYFVITSLLLPLLLVGFLMFSRGRKYLRERIGIWSFANEGREGEPYVWFHGASMGEIKGLLPVLEEVNKSVGHQYLVVTSTTATGKELLLEKGYRAFLLPFDCELLYRFAWKGKKLKAIVISETEIWPGLLWQFGRRHIPIIVINARISDKSWKVYRLFRPIFASLLNVCEKILVSDEISYSRYLKLGVLESKLFLTGNTKYDFEPSVINIEDARALRRRFFANRNKVITLGSLRPNEEKIWFDAVARAYQNGILSGVGIVVAPRHPEKFDFFADKLRDFNIPYERWSQVKFGNPSESVVVLLDTLGELEKVYSFSDVSFIGGSLEDFGGHNPLEAAAYGSAIVMGESTFGVRDIVNALDKLAGVLTVRDINQAYKVIEKFSLSPVLFQKVGLQGQTAWRNFRGAKSRVLDKLEPYLKA